MSCGFPLPPRIAALLDKGVVMPDPRAVALGDDVPLSAVSGQGVTLYPGTRLSGPRTLLLPGVALGAEGPVTAVNCRLGKGASLKGGYAEDSVLLDGASLAAGAHVRPGCLLEEAASGAHTVGLKQTILFPFVTLGSLVNFCDCLMAGGTGRRNHSEVGSSYIHFNFTPNADKATASLLGDVPRGVMLKSDPIFLGGQGGLVGPIRLGYGTVAAAGSILREDFPDGGVLLARHGKDRTAPFIPGFYPDIRRRVFNNILYVANLQALKIWYGRVRRRFAVDAPQQSLVDAGQDMLDMIIAERLQRLGQLADNMGASIRAAESLPERQDRQDLVPASREFASAWPAVKTALTAPPRDEAGTDDHHAFLAALDRVRDQGHNDYLSAISALSDDATASGTRWLSTTVNAVVAAAYDLLPACRPPSLP